MDVIKELLEHVDTLDPVTGNISAAISQCMADYEGWHLGKRETEEFLDKLK
jgi:hypothetical protein